MNLARDAAPMCPGPPSRPPRRRLHAADASATRPLVDMLRQVFDARVGEVLSGPTPLDPLRHLSERLGRAAAFR